MAKPGLFEDAEGGTLFLDEIGDLPLQVKVKLNRALQEKEIRRVGENRPVQIDVRLIAATIWFSLEDAPERDASDGRDHGGSGSADKGVDSHDTADEMS